MMKRHDLIDKYQYNPILLVLWFDKARLKKEIFYRNGVTS